MNKLDVLVLKGNLYVRIVMGLLTVFSLIGCLMGHVDIAGLILLAVISAWAIMQILFEASQSVKILTIIKEIEKNDDVKTPPQPPNEPPIATALGPDRLFRGDRSLRSLSMT